MDEAELRTLISKGESDTVDFKRELDLGSAKGKAEFVKDVISIANSSPTKGYLFIGVDNNSNIVGTDQLEEERIQQIAYTYISPPVVINCYCVTVNDTESVRKVGVIEIWAQRKPHKVAKELEPIHQDDVFIRRGSVVMKASPEEIVIMHNSSAGIEMKIQEICQRAKAHAKIGNIASAISLYSEAINFLPSAELLISRAKLYKEQNDWVLAFDDYTNSLKLGPSISEEKAARLGRVRINYYRDNQWEDFEKDYHWLREHTEGYERGEVIFTYVNSWDYNNIDRLGDAEEMVTTVDEAIDLGYDNPEIYYLRSFGNKAASNFGTALHDIDKAILMVHEDDRKVAFLCHRAEVLVGMKNFQEAHKTLEEARKIDKEGVRQILSLDLYNSVEDILCLFGLDKKYYGEEDVRREPIYSMLRLFLVWSGRRIVQYATNNEGKIIKVKTKLDEITSRHPSIVSSLVRLLSDEEKLAIRDITAEYIFKIKLPTLNEQTNGKDRMYVFLPSVEDED